MQAVTSAIASRPLDARSLGFARTLRAHRRAWWLITLMLPIAVQLAQLLLLCIRFGALPNYATLYDWPGNLVLIVWSVPSLRDILSIASDEWLLEIGHKAVIYGLSVTDWRLAILPAKLLVLLLVGALAATNWILLRDATSRACTVRRAVAGSLTASGTLCVSVSAVTISWIACCGVPSWVTGLSILGLDYSAALLLKPYGAVVAVAGCALLASGTLVLAYRGRGTRRARVGRPREEMGRRR